MWGIYSDSKRRLGHTAILAPGLLLGGLTVRYLLRPEIPFIGRLVSLLAVTFLSVPLLFSSYWLVQLDPTADQIWRIVSWCVGGSLPITGLAVLTVVFQRAHGVALARPVLVITWVAGVGAFGGFLTGVYDLRRQRKHADERATAHRLQTLLDASPVAIISIDRDGTVQRWNTAAETIFGWDEEEVIGEPYPIVPECKEDEFQRHLTRANSGETIEGVETRRETRDGALVDVSIGTAPVFDAEQTLHRTIITAADVSERKEQERELRRTYDFLDSALDAVPDLFYVLDPSGDLDHWNTQVTKATGYGDEELASMSALDFFTDDEHSRIDTAIQATLEEDAVGTAEAELVTKSGDTIPYEFRTKPLNDRNGDTLGLVGIGRDITERIQREQRLRETTQLLQAVIDAAPLGIVHLDEDGEVELWNREAEELFGYGEEDVLGEVSPVAPDGEPGGIYDRLRDPSEGQYFESLEATRQRKDGSQITVHLWAKPLFDGNDRFAGVVQIFAGVGDRIRREQQLTVLNRVLRHNIRNTVNAIGGHANLLATDLDDTSLQGQAETIAEQARTLEHWSEEAKGLNRILQRDTVRSPKQLPELVDQSVTRIREIHPDAEITTDVQSDVWVYADTSIGEALHMIIENAIEHNDRATPEVVVSVQRRNEPGRAEITVADNGPGIPDLERKVLENGDETPLMHSTGVGLWGIYLIANRNGGEISITDNDPRGSVVSIVLPTADHKTSPAAVEGTEY